MYNSREWALHLLDPSYTPSLGIGPKSPQSGPLRAQFKDVYSLNDQTKEMKGILAGLKSGDANQRKISFVVLALIINSLTSCASKELLLVLKQCYHEDYIFFNLLSKTSLIRKKDLEIFKPSVSKKQV
jgi:hypothetical protein